MDIRESLRAMNRRVAEALADVLDGPSDEQLATTAPAIDARSIAAVAVHAYAGVRAFTTVAAGRPWPEKIRTPATGAALRALLDDTRAKVDVLLAGMDDAALQREVALPWGETIPALDDIVGSLSHALVHTGKIAGMRTVAGFPTPPEAY